MDEKTLAREIRKQMQEEFDERASNHFWGWLVIVVALIIGALVLFAAYTAAWNSHP